jgi:hypothetical protein
MSRSSQPEIVLPRDELVVSDVAHDVYGPLRREHAHELMSLIADAHRACRDRDAAALSRVVARIVALAPESLSIDLKAVVEIAPRDLELATVRWSHLSKLLA